MLEGRRGNYALSATSAMRKEGRYCCLLLSLSVPMIPASLWPSIRRHPHTHQRSMVSLALSLILSAHSVGLGLTLPFVPPVATSSSTIRLQPARAAAASLMARQQPLTAQIDPKTCRLAPPTCKPQGMEGRSSEESAGTRGVSQSNAPPPKKLLTVGGP